MSDNEAKAVPATNATASSGPGGGPLVVSELNPRYFTVAASEEAHRIPTVVYGPGGSGAHAAVEWVELDDLEVLRRVLLSTAEVFCA
jgi:acetylornithine deacetylase